MENINIDYIKSRHACQDGIDWFLSKNEVDFNKVYEYAKLDNKLPYINWYITRLMIPKQRIKYAIFAAEKVKHIWEQYDKNDKRPQLAIAEAKKYLNNANIANTAYTAYDANANANANAAAYAAYAAYAAAANVAAYNAAYAANAAANDAYAAANAAAYAAANNVTSEKAHLINIIDFGVALLEDPT